ncbi:RHS repeat domain-containing protein [Pseudomonas sp. LP_7_YM]|uniref:RHS repeat domain-containing protein n=1 Tax=Pseudomonas sp. LP_7_YM TaxID=2485137 RepID=UPI00105C67B1|nr:RHS repeat-associated core domain-containing protein [Pseudomonas sp. LP_7_YM]TDV60507.1 RHS repeat-associated protein [Pseudomonas sp. LP_7_YM]
MDALQESYDKNEGDDYVQEGFKTLIDGIKSTVEEQSKRNSRGFKLASMKAGSMEVQELSYQSKQSDPGFGHVKSTKSYRLSAEGKKIVDSEVDTSFDYSVDSKNKRKITLKTTVKTANTAELVSSQTREGFFQRLVESTDTQGLQKIFSYQKWLQVSETIKQGGKTLSTITKSHTLIPETRQHQFEISFEESGMGDRVIVDEYGRDVQNLIRRDASGEWLCASEYQHDGAGRVVSLVKYGFTDADKQLPLTTVNYDEQGHINCVLERDYTASSDKHSTLTTTWVWDTRANTCTKTVVLADAKDVVIDRKVEVLKVDTDGTTITQGSFSKQARYDVKSRTVELIERGAGGADGTLKTKGVYNEGGRLVSVDRFSVKGEKEKSLANDAFVYDANHRLVSQTDSLGSTTRYEYDQYDRLLSQDKNGVVIRNSYPDGKVVPIASEATVEGGPGNDSAIVLGTQVVDALSRLSERAANSHTETYLYKGGSRLPEREARQGPEVLSGYVSMWDQATHTYTETCPVRDTLDGSDTNTLSTSTLLSFRGQVLKLTDIAGQVTTYTYDAYDRLINTISAVCRNVFSYADNGRLATETIQDLTGKRSLTVTYVYDLLGRETSRTFSGQGMATHTLERELTVDGRLACSTLKVNGKQDSSDHYTYDANKRLIGWTCTNKGHVIVKGDVPLIGQSFTYDLLGHVTQTQLEYEKTNGYTAKPRYDQEFVAGKPGLLSKHGGDTISSDSEGRLTSKDVSYYDNGKVRTSRWAGTRFFRDSMLAYGYDDLGRIRGQFPISGNNIEHGYQFHYRLGNIYARTEKYRHLILLNESRGCYLQQNRTKNGESVESVSTSFELRDAAGTVFATIDEKGGIEYHSYTPYGSRIFDEKSAHWLGFKGEPQLWDGQYYLGSNRLYDPKLMSFRTPDPLSPFGPGGPAAYAFCEGDPVNYHDPSGYSRESTFSYVQSGPVMNTKEFRIAMAVAGVALAPLTGGGSLTIVMTTGWAVLGAGLEIASIVLEESDPELASTLGVLGFAAGLGGMAAEIVATARMPERGVRGFGKLKTGRYLDGNALRINETRTMKFEGGSGDIRYQAAMNAYMQPRMGPSGNTIWMTPLTTNSEVTEKTLLRIFKGTAPGVRPRINIFSGTHGSPYGVRMYKRLEVDGRFIDNPFEGLRMEMPEFYAADEQIASLYRDKADITVFNVGQYAPEAGLEPRPMMRSEMWRSMGEADHSIMAFCHSSVDQDVLGGVGPIADYYQLKPLHPDTYSNLAPSLPAQVAVVPDFLAGKLGEFYRPARHIPSPHAVGLPELWGPSKIPYESPWTETLKLF